MDNKLTKEIQEWLEKESYSEEEILAGARMVLKLNKNQALYNTIVRKPERYVKKIRYELARRLPMRLDNMTKSDVIRLEKEILPPVETAVRQEDEKEGTEDVKNADDGKAVAAGKRDDHDELPDEIKAIWDKNAERWKKIKKLYYTCKQLDKPCDRYEYLKILKEEWYAYKEAFNIYDNYSFVPDADDNNEITVKDITNARAYISKNLERLEKMSKDDDAEKYQDLYNKVLERVNVIMSSGESFSPEMKERLSTIFTDLNFDEKNIQDTQTADI